MYYTYVCMYIYIYIYDQLHAELARPHRVAIGAAVVHTKSLSSCSLQLYCRPLAGFSGSLTPVVGGTICLTLPV